MKRIASSHDEKDDSADDGVERQKAEDPIEALSLDGEEAENGNEEPDSAEGSINSPAAAKPLTSPIPKRKRKRSADDDDLEGAYLDKLAREEEEEQQKLREERREKRQRLEQDESESGVDNVGEQGALNGDVELSPPPQHESLQPSTSKTDIELDKAARTVFLANISISAITSSTAKKELLTHLTSHISTLPPSSTPHKISSFRFRSTAYAASLPKKASFTTAQLKESTSHSTNAYCVYSTKIAAREAARHINGTVVLGRHLRVDEVAHPMKIDHRRCVFVGNLGFVDDETEMKAALANSDHPEDKKKANSKAQKSDIEEGLWVQFAKAGVIESVRVVRDSQTRIGKGFAYVQFKEENPVERALLFNDKEFPPMLPRKLRVARCKKPSQTAGAMEKNKAREREAERAERAQKDRRSKRRSTPESSNGGKPDEQALQGRLKKMLGKAGVAEMRTAAKGSKGKPKPAVNSVLKGEPEVFEGHRARSDEGNSGLKLGGMKRKKDRGQVKKRSDRDKKRAASYKQKSRGK